MKEAARSHPSAGISADARRAVPAVERVLQALGPNGLPRPLLVDQVRRELAAVRATGGGIGLEEAVARIREALDRIERSRLRPVINATGILIHTNLGRAPLSPAAAHALQQVASGYCSLEFDLESGARGRRGAYVEQTLALACGSEAATVVNNCAAALVLVLRHFTARRREVVLSRGELVQIGGGFRVPEILEASGAVLREVGTTNQTSIEDYARAIGPDTGLILKVHASNFFMDGFVGAPSREHLAALARARGVPLVEDLGSGAIFPTDSIAGLPAEPTPAESLRQGVDVVTFSGDKLLGGPQAGIIAGRAEHVAALKHEPFFRALRCDKLVLAALEATVDEHLANRAAASLPLQQMLRASPADLRARATRIAATLARTTAAISIAETQAEIGGGSMPRAELPSAAVEIAPAELTVDALAARLRHGAPAVVGVIARGRLRLDVRSVLPEQDETLIRAVSAALGVPVAAATGQDGKAKGGETREAGLEPRDRDAASAIAVASNHATPTSRRDEEQ